MDYRRMYGILCRAASAALDMLPDTPENFEARFIIQKALLEAEEVYLADGETTDEQTV